MNQVLLSKVDKDAIQRHIFGSYTSIRFGMASIAFAFPIVVYAFAKLKGVDLQGSLSAYYWAAITGEAPGRLWFVGGLFSIAAFLYLYKGFTKGENYALNLAAVFALGVAYFPMEWNCSKTAAKLSPVTTEYCVDGWNWHGTCAVALFVCLAYVTFLRSRDTLPALDNPKLERRYKYLYWLSSTIMLLAPLIAIALHDIRNQYDTLTYWLEFSGIWAFATFWAIKSFEMRHSRFEANVTRKRTEA